LAQNQTIRQLGAEATKCTPPLSNRFPHCSDRSQFFSSLSRFFPLILRQYWERHYQKTVEVPSTHFYCYGKWNFGALLALLLILVFVPDGVREPLMLFVAMVSYFFTPQRVFEANEFSWRPLIEVAWIFLCIFGTVIPVLDYVEFHANDFHLTSDARFYWSTGLLSGVLDNAPTYLTFLTAALSLEHLDINHLPDVAQFAFGHGSRLAAISLAATLFGGLTYIGNSPNLLIRAIAESRHVPTPGFLAYIIRYALPILMPVLGLVGLIFFRG